jgi:hypothetical protein
MKQSTLEEVAQPEEAEPNQRTVRVSMLTEAEEILET